MTIELKENQWDTIPKRPELSSNGGDYYFGHRDVFVDGTKVGELQTTSSEFDYCQIRGSFTQTIGHPFADECIEVGVSLLPWNEDAESYDYLSESEIVDLLT